MFKLIAVTRSKAKKVSGIIGVMTVALAVTASNALAVLSIDQQAAVDSITTLIADLSTVAWGIVLTMLGVMLGIKLVRKFLGKAT